MTITKVTSKIPTFAWHCITLPTSEELHDPHPQSVFLPVVTTGAPVSLHSLRSRDSGCIIRWTEWVSRCRTRPVWIALTPRRARDARWYSVTSRASYKPSASRGVSSLHTHLTFDLFSCDTHITRSIQRINPILIQDAVEPCAHPRVWAYSCAYMSAYGTLGVCNSPLVSPHAGHLSRRWLCWNAWIHVGCWKADEG